MFIADSTRLFELEGLSGEEDFFLKSGSGRPVFSCYAPGELWSISYHWGHVSCSVEYTFRRNGDGGDGGRSMSHNLNILM